MQYSYRERAVYLCNFEYDVVPPRAHEGGFFMLYTAVTNDWGETTYVPTALGNVLLVVVLAALLAVAVYLPACR